MANRRYEMSTKDISDIVLIKKDLTVSNIICYELDLSDDEVNQIIDMEVGSELKFNKPYDEFYVMRIQ